MSIANLTTGAARIHESVDLLQKSWEDTKDHWNDQNCERFEKDHLQPLLTEVNAALVAINHLSDVIHQVHRACDEQPS